MNFGLHVPPVRIVVFFGKRRVSMRWLALALALVTPALAGEYAVLANGFRIHADRHELAGNIVRLHTRQGVIELPAAEVQRFEQEDWTPPPPPPPAAKAEPFAAASTAAPTAQQLLDQAATHNGLPPAIIRSVAAVESNFRNDVVSPKGAVGIMQLMPATAAAHSADPHNPEENVEAGARYLRELLLRFNGDVAKALAAYNAGPAAVERYKGVPPFPETLLYVDKVIRRYKKSGGE